jgi:predicted Na+-dependent transporter
MSYLPSIAVLLLMLSTGMSLNWRQFVENWRKLALGGWARLLLVTFILPPVLVLLLAQVLPMTMASMAGLYLIRWHLGRL